MIIFVEAKTKAKVAGIKKIGVDTYLVATTKVPENGKANVNIIAILADFFDVPKSAVMLISGASSKKKKFEVTS